MQAKSLVFALVLTLSGCRTAYYPRIVNYTEYDLRVRIEFDDGRRDEWTLQAGDGAWLGRKDIEVASIEFVQRAEMRTLTKEDFQKFGIARAYAFRSLDDIQKIK